MAWKGVHVSLSQMCRAAPCRACVRGALKGCSATATRRSTPDAPALTPDDAVAIANAFLASVHVRSLAVADRQLSFSLLLELGQVLNAFEHP